MTPLHPGLKKVAKTLSPSWLYATVRSIRSRNYQKQLHKEWGVEQATREMIEQCGLTVLHGPFQGMHYPRASMANRDGIPILFGTYELELHAVIEEAVSKSYQRIIDIGSAEGYYAVGLALRTRTPVFAYDCEPRERAYLRQMARLNGVADLVHTGSWCSERILERLTRGQRCLVISDCEGYEFNLFQGPVLTGLNDCDLLIELHDLVPDFTAASLIHTRFGSSHRIRTITFDRCNLGSVVPERWRNFAREFRSAGQQWVFLTPTHYD